MKEISAHHDNAVPSAALPTETSANGEKALNERVEGKTINAYVEHDAAHPLEKTKAYKLARLKSASHLKPRVTTAPPLTHGTTVS